MYVSSEATFNGAGNQSLSFCVAGLDLESGRAAKASLLADGFTREDSGKWGGSRMLQGVREREVRNCSGLTHIGISENDHTLRGSQIVIDRLLTTRPVAVTPS